MKTESNTTSVEDLAAELAKDGFRAIGTLREAAMAARLHYQTAWEQTQTGNFPAFRRGGRWLVRRAELARWLLRGGLR
jgi:hypothetical protein